MTDKKVEQHPLLPFLPHGAELLMLGSFPPAREKWSMDFFYPNIQNDMWRIFGHIFFSDREHFLAHRKAFHREHLIHFLTEKRIALYDTATAVRRLKDNASDKFLEIVQPTDIPALLSQIPHCKTIVTTGEKATEIICTQLSIPRPPKMGEHVSVLLGERKITLYRLPSSSRAYPLSIEQKAAYYREMFTECGLFSPPPSSSLKSEQEQRKK